MESGIEQPLEPDRLTKQIVLAPKTNLSDLKITSLNRGRNPGFLGILAILDLIFAGVLSRGSHESVLKSSNFDLKDGLYAIVI